jgi:hypothetical protein
LFQLEDTEASIALVLPSTAQAVLDAIQLIDKTSMIRVLSFGPVDGCDNILNLIEEVKKVEKQ